MSTEFRPIESAPTRRAWPFALVGAALVIALVWSLRRSVALGDLRPQPQALTNVASEPKIAPLVSETVKPPAETPKPPASPNLLGEAVTAAKSLAMVAKSELDRALAKSESAQRQAAAYRRQVADLEKQLAEARTQIAGLQKARQPPPPSDQEQILQMLAPVLRTGASDGHP